MGVVRMGGVCRRGLIGGFFFMGVTIWVCFVGVFLRLFRRGNYTCQNVLA